MTRIRVAILVASIALTAACQPDSERPSAATAQSAPTAAAPHNGHAECDEGNGGITLPDGFCARVFADDLGRGRHLVVRDNGDVYLALRGDGGGIYALRDSDGDGRAEVREKFGDTGGTGIGLHAGFLYFATDNSVMRYALMPGELVPKTEPETVVAGFLNERTHAAKPFEIDDQGWLHVNVGAPANACQNPRRKKETPGQDPCPLLERSGGVWRYRADQLGQDAYRDGERFATGIRNGVANDWNPETKLLYVAQHGRDQLSELWPDLYTDEQRAELPAEELFVVEQGDDFGWPYCYYDSLQNKKVLAPEYGGDGNRVGRCDEFEDPLVAFPAHWGPNDLQFYFGTQFPPRYRGGAFVAFHGSWNRQPFGQAGYNVVFVPFDFAQPAGRYEIFADDFAGTTSIRAPGDAAFRPTGLAVGGGGALFVSDSVHGRIWKISYIGME